MGTTKENSNQALLERTTATEEWWTALSFEDGDLALESDPVLTEKDETADEIELRLYSF